MIRYHFHVEFVQKKNFQHNFWPDFYTKFFTVSLYTHILWHVYTIERWLYALSRNLGGKLPPGKEDNGSANTNRHIVTYGRHIVWHGTHTYTHTHTHKPFSYCWPQVSDLLGCTFRECARVGPLRGPWRRADVWWALVGPCRWK